MSLNSLFRLFLNLLIVVPLFLHANGEIDEPKEDVTKEPTDFSECQKRVSKSLIEISKNEYALLIDKNRAIYYSKTKPKSGYILKHDPFLGLYLLSVESEEKPLEISLNYQNKELAVITKDNYEIGKIMRVGSPVSFAKFSTKTAPNSIIASICYQVHGLGIGGNEFIEAKYIAKFLERETITYADMGIEFYEDNNGVVVSLVDIFFPNNPFLEGDRIVEIDGQKIENKRDFYDAYIYEPIGKELKVGIIRDGKRINKSVVLGKYIGRNGGFLERLGVSLNQNLEVISNSSDDSGLKWLKVGDRILMIDRLEVDSIYTLKRILSNSLKREILMLIERDGFQFFIKVTNKREL